MTTSCPNPLWRTDPVQVFVIAMLDSANYWWLLSLLRCGVQMLVVYLPWLQQVFQTEALSPNDLAFIVFVASSMVALDTARKLLFPDRQGETSVSVTSFTVATPGLDGTSIGRSRSRPSAIVQCLCPAEFCFSSLYRRAMHASLWMLLPLFWQLSTTCAEGDTEDAN